MSGSTVHVSLSTIQDMDAKLQEAREKLRLISQLTSYTAHAVLDDPGGPGVIEVRHEPGRGRYVLVEDIHRVLDRRASDGD